MSYQPQFAIATLRDTLLPKLLSGELSVATVNAYAVGHGPHLAPGEPAAERQSFGEVVLVGRLREAIRRLNPAIPEEARAVIRTFRIVHIFVGREPTP